MLDRHRHADRTILVFHQLNRTYHNAANSQLAQRNLQDVNNPMVLFVLFQALEREDAGIPTQKKLAELLHVSPATVANSLKSLERGGYVRKEADPADARCNRVFLTDRGRRAVPGVRRGLRRGRPAGAAGDSPRGAGAAAQLPPADAGQSAPDRRRLHPLLSGPQPILQRKGMK